MKDRIITLIGGMLSLLIVLSLIMPSSQTQPGTVSRPTSMDRGEFGLAGLKAWLDKSDIPNISFRRRYTDLLSDAHLAVSGNLLIISLPQSKQANANEIDDLYDWLLMGNSAVILTAKNDRPNWSYLNSMGLSDESTQLLLNKLGFQFDVQTEDEPGAEMGLTEKGSVEKEIDILQALETVKDSLEKKQLSFISKLEHDRLQGVDNIATTVSPRFVEHEWSLKSEGNTKLALPLLFNKSTASAVFWEIHLGGNSLWLSSYPDLFGNLSLANKGNARLIANIIEFSLGPEGYVIFDDFHFGLSDLYDPNAFFTDSRLHNTLVFVFVFWFLYLMGRSNRLISPKPRKNLPQAADFVEAMAGFFFRQLSDKAIAKGLIEHFFNEIRVQYNLPEDGKPVWNYIDKPFIANQDIRHLKEYVKNLSNRKNIDINKVTKTLNNIRKSLQ